MKRKDTLDPRQEIMRARSLARAIKKYWSRKGHYSGGQHTIPQKGEGVQWADVREYQYGDEVKWISWRHSSRSPNETWVKTFEVERAHRSCILLDRSESMVQGILQNRYQRAWWVSTVLAYIVLKQKDLCSVFNSDIRALRHQLMPLHNETHVTQWANDQFDTQKIKKNPDPLHIQIQKLSRVLKRYTSIILVTDGYDNFEALQQSLKTVSRHHQVLVILFPDLFHVSKDFCQLADRYRWRFFCHDSEVKHTYVSQIRHVSEEWHQFWSSLRMPRVISSVCHPHDDEMKFIQKLLKR